MIILLFLQQNSIEKSPFPYTLWLFCHGLTIFGFISQRATRFKEFAARECAKEFLYVYEQDRISNESKKVGNFHKRQRKL